ADQAGGHCQAARARGDRRYQRRCLAPVRDTRIRDPPVRPRGATGGRVSGVAGMATIAATHAPRTRSRFLLDRAELIGPLLIAPAIVYVLLLVALPFFLAIYYSISAFTIFDPNYRFVGLSNFSDIIKSEVFRRTLIN